jgi:hypothetical protein
VRLFDSIFEPNSFFKVVSAQSINSNNPDNSYLLLKKIGRDTGKVLYSGTMSRIYEKILTSPHRINDDAIESFARCINDIIELANRWLDETGSEFILDPDFYQITY